MRTETQPSGSEFAPDSDDRRDQGHNHEDFRTALAELVHAVQRRKVESICGAYQQLRQAANGMRVKDLFAVVDNALKGPSEDIVVSAYSHRHCFMCTDGTNPCDQCEGTGYIEEGRCCPHCDGAGVVPCAFCNGTAWADRETIPHELAKAVLQRQRSHVRAEIQRVAKTFSGLSPEAISQFSPQKRRAAMGRLLRLQARLESLANHDSIDDPNEQTHLGAMAARLETCLQQLCRI